MEFDLIFELVTFEIELEVGIIVFVVAASNFDIVIVSLKAVAVSKIVVDSLFVCVVAGVDIDGEIEYSVTILLERLV